MNTRKPDTPPAGYSLLGVDCRTGKPVTIGQEQRRTGIYVIGKTGSGKTTQIVNLALQDIEQGMGAGLITLHADAITDILKRLPPHRENDVILLDPMDKTHAFGLNLFQCNNPDDHEEVSRVISSVIEVFAKLFTQSGDLMQEAPNMAETLQMALPVLIAHQSPRMTLAEIPLLTMDQTARTNLLAPLHNPLVTNFWQSYNRWKPDIQNDLTASTRKRVNDFTINPLILEVVGQSETTLDFSQIMDTGKILLVKLPRKPEIVAGLLGSVLIEQIAAAAFSRDHIPEAQRVQFNLYADEYQRFSTPTFAELLTEVRKFRIATCVAHQFRDQLDKANRGATLNAGNLIVFQVSGEDAKELAPQFKRVPPDPHVEWLEEEDGVIEQDKAIAQNPVDWLRNNTHENPRVRKLAADLFNPLFAALDAVDTKDLYGPEKMGATRRQLSQGVRLLKSLLVDVMEQWLPVVDTERKGMTRRFAERLADILLMLGGYLGLTSGIKYQFRDLGGVHGPVWEGSFVEREIPGHTRDKLVVFLLHCWSLGNEPGRGGCAAERALQEQLLADREAQCKEYKPYFYRSTVTVPGDSLSREPVLFLYLGEITQPEIAAALEKLKQEVSAVIGLCRLLVTQPIMVHTGQEKRLPRKHPVITQRSYPEMENKIASELANPPLPYAAHAKLGTEEYTIQALPFGEPDADAVWMARQERIIERTRAQYCRKREDVDEEIMARQSALTKREPPASRTTRDEDEV